MSRLSAVEQDVKVLALLAQRKLTARQLVHRSLGWLNLRTISIVLRRLVNDGSVVRLSAIPTGVYGAPSKRYHITAAGQERLLAYMRILQDVHPCTFEQAVAAGSEAKKLASDQLISIGVAADRVHGYVVCVGVSELQSESRPDVIDGVRIIWFQAEAK